MGREITVCTVTSDNRIVYVCRWMSSYSHGWTLYDTVRGPSSQKYLVKITSIEVSGGFANDLFYSWDINNNQPINNFGNFFRPYTLLRFLTLETSVFYSSMSPEGEMLNYLQNFLTIFYTFLDPPQEVLWIPSR